jgi:hypothetical protein
MTCRAVSGAAPTRDLTWMLAQYEVGVRAWVCMWSGGGGEGVCVCVGGCGE